MKTMKLLFLALVFLSFNLGKTEAQIVISYDKERDSPVRIDNAEVIIDGVTYKFHTSVINVKYDASGTVPTEFTITDGYFEVTGYNDNQASEVNLLKEFATRSGDGAIGRGYVTFSLAAGTSGFIRFLDDEGEEVNELSPEIVFPVTIYPDDLFRNKENLTSVTIHDNFTKIPAYYFQGCTNLQHVELPNTITSIGYAAFRDLVNLTGELHLPSSLKSIGNYAFYGCSGLTGNLTIPKGVTTIGNYAFRGCSGFTGSLTIPERVTTIGGGAFNGCSGFTGSLTIPEGVTTIGGFAFRDCSGFTGSLTIPEGVTTIGDGAFYGCSGFTGSLTIPETVTTIGNSAFWGCRGFTGSLTIPERVTTIEDCAFSGCSGFTGSLTIPEGVTNIGKSAFNSCSGFTGSLTIPEGVTTIQWMAFKGCSGFTGSLIIPKGVTTIEGCAFYGCSGFTGSLTIPEGVTTIEESAFHGCSGFTGSLTIPEGVTTIGDDAFYRCSGFTGSLTIPETVTTIGNYAFDGCSGFTGSLTIPEGVTTIGGSAFYGCSGFTGSLTIPEGVTTIGDLAFCDCSGFTGSLTIPEGVTNIGKSAFNRCSGFTGSLTIPEGVTTIQWMAFNGCSGFTGSLIIPKGVTTIEGRAFYGCSGFTGSLTIPEGVTTIGDNAFWGFNVTHVISKIQEPFQCSPWSETPSWNPDFFTQTKLIVPAGTRDAYLATADWNKFSQITEAVVLEETSTEEPMAINDVNVWMERTIKADEWSTICLPFAMTAEQVKATFGEDVELGDFAGYEITKDVNDQVVGLNVKFNDATAIQANHPYIIKVTNDMSDFLVEEVNVTPVENPVYAVVERTATQKSEFVGTYVAETVVPSDALFLSGNKFWYSTGLTKMKAFRAYFDFYDILPEVEGAGAPVFISFGGETTRLDQLNIDGEDSNYYDLNGRVVKTPQKGVYIRNGKKVIVK